MIIEVQSLCFEKAALLLILKAILESKALALGATKAEALDSRKKFNL
jgi:hypothetical protein